MDKTEIRQTEEIQIDLNKIFYMLKKKFRQITLTSAAGAVAALLISLFLITPKYQSSVMFYVTNGAMQQVNGEHSISAGDISAARELVKSYIVILNTRETLNAVIEDSGVDRSFKEVKRMIHAEAVDNTELFEILVTGTDPQETESVADAISRILPQRIGHIIEGYSAKVVDPAEMTARIGSTDPFRNTLIGFLTGLVFSVGSIILWVIFDQTIRTESDIAGAVSCPVLTAIADIEIPNGRNKNCGSGMESYKLLRTKLGYLFGEEKKSRIICISSALAGEGKTETAINLAHSLSQQGSRVILLDCDAYHSNMAAKQNLAEGNGLFDFLEGHCELKEIIQKSRIPNSNDRFLVVSAGGKHCASGDLLGSARMQQLLSGLCKICDYVILDMPPVGQCSDVLTLAGWSDGVLLVVRQDLCHRTALQDTVRQLNFVNAKILGVVYNCPPEKTKTGK